MGWNGDAEGFQPRLTQKELDRMRLGDGGARWGWLIAIIFSAFVAVLQFVYFQATVNQSMSDVKERLGTLENEWHTFLRETRGITLPPRQP